MAPQQTSQPSAINLLLGASLNIFECATLGQPFEVLKTHMAANRQDTLAIAAQKAYTRGGMRGFYQGLWPWAIIEASSKGAMLIFAAAEVEQYTKKTLGVGKTTASILGGMGGGIAQAYATMGFCTFMKTVEVTRHKATGAIQPSSLSIARDIFKREGIRGINKGVNAVAVRQCTNWGSRFGISRIMENLIQPYRAKDKQGTPLTPFQKILASALGGGLSCWNQPIEVIRVELQSQVPQPGRPKNLGIFGAAKWIVSKSGVKGLYRGVVPRICLGVWQTICMVTGGDYLKGLVAARK